MGLIVELLVTLLLTFIIGFVVFYKYKFSYWKRKNLQQLEPSIPFGNVGPAIFQQKSTGELIQAYYIKLKEKQKKYGGFYALYKPVLLVTDPEIIRIILTKNFQNFHDREMVVDEETEPVSLNMFNVKGMQWRFLRTKLSPAFSSGKLKSMYDIFLKVSEQLTYAMDLEIKNNEKINIREISGRFTTDVIISTAFGLDCNSLKNPDVEFWKYGKMIFRSTFWLGLARLLTTVSSTLMKLLKLRQFDKLSADFFMNTIKQTIEYRETNKIERKDFMDLLIRLKNNESIDDDVKSDLNLKNDVLKENKNLTNKGLTFNELAANAFSFFFAGFETSSSTMTYCMLELAQNLEIQEKLRQEINEVAEQNNGKFTYDAIMEMSYLNKVVKETLRKYPVATTLNRKCVKSFTIPDDDFIIEKDTTIFISILGMHRDPDYFPDPLKFDPERFTDEQNSKRNPYTYLPFGEGPRNCIGMRFGLLQTKLGLATMIRNYRFTLDPETELPLTIDPATPLYANLNTIWLRAEKL